MAHEASHRQSLSSLKTISALLNGTAAASQLAGEKLTFQFIHSSSMFHDLQKQLAGS